VSNTPRQSDVVIVQEEFVNERMGF
jgi:hypothetical protein